MAIDCSSIELYKAKERERKAARKRCPHGYLAREGAWWERPNRLNNATESYPVLKVTGIRH
jgi:hypothetical protein